MDALGTPKTASEIGEQVGASSALAEAILDVLAALDLVQVAGDTYVFSAGMSTYISMLGKTILRGDLRATQLLTEDFAERFRVGGASVVGWHYDPAILQAWGMRSVEQVVLWTDRLFRLLDGLTEALQTPQARFLDVGTGVGRLAIAMCRQFPNLQVVGLDPYRTAINLARQNVAEEGLSDRIDLRCMPVQELTDMKSFDLAWVPGMFLNPTSVAEGFHRIRDALRPGGWLIVGTVAAEGEGIQPAVLKLMSVLFSGGLLQSKEAAEILEQAGFDDVRMLPAAQGLPNRTIVGRRPVE